MATPATGAEIVAKTREELQEELFARFFDSVLEQSGMTPEQQTALGAYLDPQSEAPLVLAKRDEVATFIHKWAAEAEFLRSQEVLLAERRRNIETFLGHFKGGMLAQFLNWGIKKVEGRLHRFSLKKNPPKIEVFDESLLPTEFMRYTPSPDKAAIKDALESGREVPGARMADETQRLEIK